MTGVQPGMVQQPDFEAEVLVLAFRDTSILAKYAGRLDPLFFKNQVYGNIWLILRRLFVTYKQAPSFTALNAEIQNELSREGGLKLFTKEDIPVILRVLPLMPDPEHYVMDRWVTDQLDQWIATRAYYIATLKAEQALLAGDPAQVPEILRAAVAIAKGGSGQHIDFFDRMVETAKAAEADLDRRINTGLTGLDKILAGGLQQGEYGLLFGLESVGKSFLANHIGASAVSYGKRVLHCTNELTLTEQERRYIAWFTDIPKRDLWERADEIDEARWADEYRGKLVIRHLPQGTTVSEIYAILEEAYIDDDPFQLVIIDYIDQLGVSSDTQIEQKEYLRLIAISSQLSALAKARNEGGQDVCVLGITHANSSAYGKKWGGGELMGGSVIGKNKVIDFGIFLGQDADLERQNLVAVSITKMRSREGQGGKIYLKQDFDRSKFLSHFGPIDESHKLETPSLK